MAQPKRKNISDMYGFKGEFIQEQEVGDGKGHAAIINPYSSLPKSIMQLIS